MLVLPRTSISTASLAFISSSAAWTCLSSASGVGAGLGILVLMTWAWLVNAMSRWRRGDRVGGEEPAGPNRRGLYPCRVQTLLADVFGDQRRQPATIAAPSCQRAPDRAGRSGMQRHRQPIKAACRLIRQRRRLITPAPRAHLREIAVQIVEGVARPGRDHEMAELEQRAPVVPGRELAEGIVADQPGQRCFRRQLAAQFAQGVDGVRVAGALELAAIEKKVFLPGDRQRDHAHALLGTRTWCRAMRRIAGGQEVDLARERIARSRGDRDVPGVYRIERAAVEDAQHHETSSRRALVSAIATSSRSSASQASPDSRPLAMRSMRPVSPTKTSQRGAGCRSIARRYNACLFSQMRASRIAFI